MKNVSSFSFLILLLFINYSCQKSSTGYVEIHGRLLNSFTNEPLPNVAIKLMADDATSAKETTKGSILLASTETSFDGTFKLRSNPSKRNNYYLMITGQSNLQEIYPKKNTVYDFGDKFLGTHGFYCKVRVISKSDSILHLQRDSYPNDFMSFEKGVNTIVLLKRTLNGETYQKDAKFKIYYNTYFAKNSDYSTSYYREIAITNLSDTLQTTIYY